MSQLSQPMPSGDAPVSSRGQSAPRVSLVTPVFALLCAAHFLCALSFNLYLQLPGLFLDLGAREAQVGMVSALMGVCAIVARPPVGRVMDRRGRRPILLVGGVLGSLACFGYFTIDHWGAWLFVVRVAHGVSEAMLFASLFALAADLVPAGRRIEGIGLFGVFGMLPVAVSGVLGDWLVSAGGYTLVMTVGAATSVASLALSWFVPEPPRAQGEAPRGLWAAARERRLLPLWVAGLLFATAISAYFILLKTFVAHHPIGKIGDFFAAYALVASALRVFLGSLPERLGPKRVVGVAMTSVALGAFVLAGADARWQLVIAGVLAGAGHGYTFPILLGLVVTRARATERGAALTLFTALFDGGTVVGGLVFGWLAEHAGYPVMFATAGSLALAGYGLLVWLDRTTRTPKAGTS